MMKTSKDLSLGGSLVAIVALLFFMISWIVNAVYSDVDGDDD